jgi:cytochrome c biogenesis protein CcmG, thiol:disulfide interchange protein DsbE
VALSVLAVALLAAVWLATLSLARPAGVIEVTGSPLVGRPAPAFSLERLDGGGAVSLADFAGRPVVVNFWASWCIPCAEEFPLLNDARRQHAPAGLEILGIVHDDDPTAAERFADAHGATWPLLLDPANDAWRAYRGVFLPVTFFVDREGVVRAVSYGTPTEQALAAQIARIVGDR